MAKPVSGGERRGGLMEGGKGYFVDQTVHGRTRGSKNPPFIVPKWRKRRMTNEDPPKITFEMNVGDVSL